jgi:hypothetical protein
MLVPGGPARGSRGLPFAASQYQLGLSTAGTNRANARTGLWGAARRGAAILLDGPTYYILRLLSLLGIVWDLKTPQ